MTSTTQDLGQIAYEKYREHTHGVSLISGQALPPWEELDDTIADAWTAAADAVEEAIGTLPPDTGAPPESPPVEEPPKEPVP